MRNGQYLRYLINAGGSVTVAEFNEDWEPIGRIVLRDLLEENVATILEGRVVLTEKGYESLTREEGSAEE